MAQVSAILWWPAFRHLWEDNEWQNRLAKTRRPDSAVCTVYCLAVTYGCRAAQQQRICHKPIANKTVYSLLICIMAQHQLSRWYFAPAALQDRVAPLTATISAPYLCTFRRFYIRHFPTYHGLQNIRHYVKYRKMYNVCTEYNSNVYPLRDTLTFQASR